MKTELTRSIFDQPVVITVWALDEGGKFSPLSRLIIAKRVPPSIEGEDEYRANEGLFSEALAGMVDEDFDAIVSPPSSRNYYLAFLDAMRRRFPGARDLNKPFCILGRLGKRGPNTPYYLTRKEDLSEVKSLLIVDDTLAKDARIGLAVGLRIKGSGGHVIPKGDHTAKKLNSKVTIYLRPPQKTLNLDARLEKVREYAKYQSALWEQENKIKGAKAS